MKKERPTAEEIKLRFTGKQGECDNCGMQAKLQWQTALAFSGRCWCCSKYVRLRTMSYRYGIDAARYNALSKSQAGRCACCGSAGTARGDRQFMLSPYPYHSPHCLLCNSCRSAAGILKTKERVLSLSRVIERSK